MKYLITFTHVDGGWDRLSPEQQKQHNEDLARFVRDLEQEKSSRLVFFADPSQARTIRRDDDGQYEVTEGTYTGAREYPGGYYIIEADSLDEAVEWARRGRFMPGANEVRPLLELA